MADKKLTALSAFTTPTDDDIFYGVDAPGTTPTSYKITWANIKAALKTYFDTLYLSIFYKNLPDGMMWNGKIVPSVASNNLTVALKTLAGNNASASDPIYINIGGTIRTVTAALSVTKNAGTNWCNAGGAELATKEVDYFAYIGYNATDGVVLGFSRIPYARLYSDFSTTTTNEKYAAISTITNAVAGNDYVNIGRFAATLSAGAGYTWSVPTYTTVNLLQFPAYETRWLTFAPAWNITLGAATQTPQYQIDMYKCDISIVFTWGAGTTGAATTEHSLPMSSAIGANDRPSVGLVNFLDASVPAQFPGIASMVGTVIRYKTQNAAGTSLTLAETSTTLPMTWTTSDQYFELSSYRII